MTEANPSKDINLYENNSTKTEKKNENKKYKKYFIDEFLFKIVFKKKIN